MGFEDKLNEFVARVSGLKGNIENEEQTKTAIIMPFFSLLGFDVFNPMEFIPEYTADVGIKKGEKVDFAVVLNGSLILIIEAKSINEQLENHDSQLFRYFGTTSAKFAILTNGIVYRFYTDLDELNKMDATPFFEINILEITDNEVVELKKFCKENFDLGIILDTASELKYLGLIKKVLRDEFTSPSDDFINFILSKDFYDGRRTQSTIEKYRPLVKKSIAQYINELVNEKIQKALTGEDPKEVDIVLNTQLDVEDVNTTQDLGSTRRVETTEEELESFYLIKSILRGKVDLSRLSFKDTVNYFSINLDGKTTKWLCRLSLKDTSKYIILLNEGSKEKIVIESIDDIYNLSEMLCKRLNKLIES